MKSNKLFLIILPVISLTSCKGNNFNELKKTVIDSLINDANLRSNKKTAYLVFSGLNPETEKTEFPSKFDLREVDTNGDGIKENYVTSVKYQSPFGSCWAFGSTASCEESILYDLKQSSVKVNEDGTLSDSLDLSEKQTTYFDFTAMKDGDQKDEGLYTTMEGDDKNPSIRLDSGSTPFAAASLYASGVGPYIEPKFTLDNNIENEFLYRGKNGLVNQDLNCYSIDDDWTMSEENRFKSSYILKNSNQIEGSGIISSDFIKGKRLIDEYKYNLLKGRALALSYRADKNRPTDPTYHQKYISDNFAHYTYESRTPSHVVSVVGWDDNYSKTNFLSEVDKLNDKGEVIGKTPVPQPPFDGAWIVKNSWGATNSIGQGKVNHDWGIDGTGYFYLSYYDMSISDVTFFDFDANGEIKNDLSDYERMQYNYMPQEVPHFIDLNKEIFESNIYKIEKNELLKYVNVETVKGDTKVKLKIYKFNEKDPSKSELLSEKEDKFIYSGHHLIKLEKPIEINKGEKIAIAYSCSNGEDFYLPIVSEYNKSGSEAGLCNDDYFANGVVNKNESFVYFPSDNYWCDFKDILDEKSKIDNSCKVTYDNFPIKGLFSIKK